MAYANLVSQACGSWSEWVVRMRDFLCKRNGTYDYSTTGIGWTLIDSSYAADQDNPTTGDWYVIYSPGEGGKEDLYVQVLFYDATYIRTYGWCYWDSVTHTGYWQYNTTGSMKIPQGTGTYSLSVWGDLDWVWVLEDEYDPTYNFMVCWGKLDAFNGTEPTIATSVAGYSSGNDVVITLDVVPTDWYVGRKIYLRDKTRANWVEIKAMSGLTITVDLTRNLDAGVKFQTSLLYVMNNSYSGTTLTAILGVLPTQIVIALSESYNSVILSSGDPTTLNGNWAAAGMYMQAADIVGGWIPHTYRLATTGNTHGDVFQTEEGVDYRYIKYYNVTYMIIKEV